jgi:dipeptidyl aminopeptidase/acylaminoacyl peptidase
MRPVICLSMIWISTGLSAEKLPVATFFRNLEYSQPRLSPGGRFLGCLSPVGARVGLAVVDLQTHEARSAWAARDGDVHWFAWVNEERLVGLAADEDLAYGGPFAVDRDGKHFLRLPAPHEPAFEFFGLVEGAPDEIRVAIRGEGVQGSVFTDLARVNVRNGRTRLEVKNPGQVMQWLDDRGGVVRVGVGADGDQVRVMHREGDGKPWETLVRLGPRDDPLEPLDFSEDGQSLYVLHGGGEDTLGLYRYDLTKHEPAELLFRHGEVDVESVTLDPGSKALVGVHYETDRPQVFWIDPEYRQIQVSIDRRLTNTCNRIVSVSRDHSRVVFLAYGDRDPGTYYLLDWNTRKWEKLFERAPSIPKEEMVEMTPIAYQARDGLRIHGYLARPRGLSDRPLPLIVNPHGGPGMRDVWGFDQEVQFFANRGWAVLRMNFRGSTGYGQAFRRAGDKEWGRKMQDDITDGVRWAVQQGIADPRRVAILGGSYGGYAALAGLVLTPELYCCGVSLAGPVDLETWLRSLPIRNLKLGRALTVQTIGDAKIDRVRLEEMSPLNHLDELRAPVFLAYGGKDRKVPVAQGKKLAAELKRRGKTFELLVKDEEGHGFSKQENRIELYQRIDTFLTTYLNP